jgi:hypothetical protein
MDGGKDTYYPDPDSLFCNPGITINARSGGVVVRLSQEDAGINPCVWEAYPDS